MKRTVDQTAYTDQDRISRRLTSTRAILAEYRRLSLPPVWCGSVLLSPALVEALQRDELGPEPQ
jgi:hypothetical protein